MIRLFLIIILLVIILVYTIFDFIVCSVVACFNKDMVSRYHYSVVRVFFKGFLFVAGVKVHIKGIENIVEDEPLFVISNHRGFFDIISGYVLLQKPCGIIAKDVFEKIPLLSYWMKKINCFFLDRKDLRSGMNMILFAIDKLKDGVSIWLFPEGTRNKNEDATDLYEFKQGSFKIPEKVDSYILPIAFYNTESIFEKQKPFIKSGNIYINVGKRFKISELADKNRENVAEYSRGVIIDLLKNIKKVYNV